MDKSGFGRDKFSNHPCHRLSVPSAKRFWCRHCFEMFDDPISRWRHSKSCKNTTLSNMMRRREQEASALEVYCQATMQTPPKDKPITLPSLNPKSSMRTYASPKDDSIVDLSCFICKRQFSSMDEIKDHVRVPCNKPSASDSFPFSTRSSSSHSVMYHRGAGNASDAGEVLQFIDGGQEARPTPLDTSKLSSETMAAVEALNMMARSENVNLTQFLNQLSEGGFVIEQAAGSSSGADGSQDREIIFTVQGGAASEPGSLLQQGGDITVEVAEDLIRMAQRVRVEAVEHVAEEQVQEEVVQDLESHTEVRYIQDESELVAEDGVYDQEQTQYAEQVQFVEHSQEQAVEVEAEDRASPEEVMQEEGQFEQEVEEGDVDGSTFTIVNLVSGKRYTGNVLVDEPLEGDSQAEMDVVPFDVKPVLKQEGESSIPVEKRKLEEDVEEVEGQVRVKVENASQVKKLCTEVSTDQNVSESNVQEKPFEAKKKLQFSSGCLIVQEKCNKKIANLEKSTLETVSTQACNNIESLPNSSHVLPECNTSHSTNTDASLHFLDEVDGEFKPMTQEMVRVQESFVDISASTTMECTSAEDIFTVIKKQPTNTLFSMSPKKLRSSSRRLVVTPKKLRLLEEKERRSKRNNKCNNKCNNISAIKKKSALNRKSIKTSLNLKVSVNTKSVKETVVNDVKTEPAEVPVKEETVPKTNEKPKRILQRSLKCRACDKVFSTERQLIKHKSVPCVVKVTRNMCQNILRPKRALPRLPEKRIIRKKSVSKESKKPKLLPVELHIHAQWLACKQERKLARGRGRPRKQTVHYERKKHIVLPDRTLEVSSLSRKEQFFFELALVCSDYVLVKPRAEIATLLTVGVDIQCDKLSVSDISPPILEKIEPCAVDSFVSEHAPGRTCSEELEPPCLEKIEFHDAAEADIISNKLCDQQLCTLDSDSKQDRHFLDSFTSDSDLSNPGQGEVSMDVDKKLRVQSLERSHSPAFDPSPKKKNLMEHLKSTLKNVCSPTKNYTPNSRKTRPDIASNTTPNSKRNLFDALQTLCSDSGQIGSTNTGTTPTLSASVLCSKLKANVARNLSPRKHVFSPSPRKTASANSSPRKMPNILRSRSASETGPEERSACILGVVAQSMGINVLNLATTASSNCSDFKSDVSPLRDTRKEPALTCSVRLTAPVEVGRKNLFEKSEPANLVNSQSIVNCMATFESESRLTPIPPTIALSNLQSGQILVRPIQAGSSKCPVKYASSRLSEVPCSGASTQLQPCASAPVQAVLGQLEQKLKLLKTALQYQAGSNAVSASTLTEKALVHLGVEESREHHRSRSRHSSGDRCVDIPDVFRSVAENRTEITFDPTDTTIVNHSESVLTICKETASDPPGNESFLVRDSPEKRLSSMQGLHHNFTESQHRENHSDLSTSPPSDCISDRVKVQYIDQLDSTMPNGLTYLLIQQDGSDFLTSCLDTDFTLETGKTTHADGVGDEEVVLGDSLLGNLYNTNLSRTDREVFVHSSGF